MLNIFSLIVLHFFKSSQSQGLVVIVKYVSHIKGSVELSYHTQGSILIWISLILHSKALFGDNVL